MAISPERVTIDLLVERFDLLASSLGAVPETVSAEERPSIRAEYLNLRRLLLVSAFTRDPGLDWFRFRCSRVLATLPPPEALFAPATPSALQTARNELDM